jgi:hypothetical protein
MMSARVKKNLLLFISIFLFAVGAFLFINRFHRSLSPKMPQPRAFPETFTFFSLGANTRLTEEFKKSFREILGPEAVSENTTMDLEIHDRGFLLRHFNALDALNQKLNRPSGERVEHHIVQLSYRYPVREQQIFHYVLILFSKYNQLPLSVEIASKDQGNSLFENMKNKFGVPQIIHDPGTPGKAWYWKQQNDFAVVSETPDRYGHPTYRIKIYFTDNIRELIKAEGLSDQNGQDMKNSGKPALF